MFLDDEIFFFFFCKLGWWDWYNNFSLIAISWKFLGKAQNNSFNFQRTIPESLWSIKLCDTRRCPTSTQSYTTVPLTLNHVKAWLTERQIRGLQQRVWERDRETNPGAPAADLRERKLVWKKNLFIFGTNYKYN